MMLSIGQLAERLNCSTLTVRRWWAAGHIPAPVRIGRALRWRVVDVEQWESKGCKPVASAATEEQPVT